MHQVLVVEDSEEYQKVVTRALGYHEVTCVATVQEAMELLGRQKYDLILLDINLPQRDGYSLLGELQGDETLREIPVLCLTGRSQVTDKVTAFSLGAEDYILKPFDPIELRARVDAKLGKRRRRRDAENGPLKAGELVIDQASHRVMIGSGEKKREIDVTQTEFKLLCCLARHPDQVYTRDQLLVAAWGQDAAVLDRVVDVHLCALRKKLGDFAYYLRSVPGIGYKISFEKPAKKRAA